jgi:hypothetical protein
MKVARLSALCTGRLYPQVYPPGISHSCITIHLIGTTYLRVMGVPASEVGYTSATTGRGDHEVHKGHAVALGETNVRSTLNDKNSKLLHCNYASQSTFRFSHSNTFPVQSTKSVPTVRLRSRQDFPVRFITQSVVHRSPENPPTILYLNYFEHTDHTHT